MLMPIRSSEKNTPRRGVGGGTRPGLMFSSADEELCTGPKGRRAERETVQMRVVRGEKAGAKRGDGEFLYSGVMWHLCCHGDL